MTKQRKTQVIVTIDNEARFTFPTVAKARRFVEKMAQSHQVNVELV